MFKFTLSVIEEGIWFWKGKTFLSLENSIVLTFTPATIDQLLAWSDLLLARCSPVVSELTLLNLSFPPGMAYNKKGSQPKLQSFENKTMTHSLGFLLPNMCF